MTCPSGLVRCFFAFFNRLHSNFSKKWGLPQLNFENLFETAPKYILRKSYFYTKCTKIIPPGGLRGNIIHGMLIPTSLIRYLITEICNIAAFAYAANSPFAAAVRRYCIKYLLKREEELN